MTYYVLLFTVSCFNPASLQYIHSGSPGTGATLHLSDFLLHQSPMPYANYFNYPKQRGAIDSYDDDQIPDQENQFYGQNEQTGIRSRRTVNDNADESSKQWLPNLVDKDKTFYITSEDNQVGSPFIIHGFAGTLAGNTTDEDVKLIDKKNFSPWGGKRDQGALGHMWTWKRETGREPSMPKRVRFSPWGGKRSGQMIYKPGNKNSKVIYAPSLPELTRIVSKYSPGGSRLNIAGIQFIPTMDKRHPIKVLALTSNIDNGQFQDIQLNRFIEAFPNIFKPGHPYYEINLKKDGKRKVKFSAWGGKRSPPIIGPIWTPASQNLKDSTLNAVLLLRSKSIDDDTAAL